MIAFTSAGSTSMPWAIMTYHKKTTKSLVEAHFLRLMYKSSRRRTLKMSPMMEMLFYLAINQNVIEVDNDEFADKRLQ